ncbi:UTRA domain-containing protein [Streptomyces sp. NPDC056192]|uniref:UTRA domain-containing protein n=1 Tax=Streptomyces sp. NPDC056192 TaxID=3345743 RepID=UPI0035E044E2
MPAPGHVPTGSPLVELSCVSLQGDVPQGLARIYIPNDLAPAGVADDDATSSEPITRFGILGPWSPTVRETVCAWPPTPNEASALRMGTTLSVLAITRVATDVTGRAVEVALLVFPGDRIDAVFTSNHANSERQAQE